jgi:hypothetical protein
VTYLALVPLVLTGPNLVGLAGVTSGRAWGWWVWLVGCPVFLAYAVTTQQWGFIPAAFISFTLDVLGLRKASTRRAA